MTKFNIVDLEKALKYAKEHHAVVISVKYDENGSAANPRLEIGISEAYKGAGATITVFCAESAKMPEITTTQTLF